MEKTTLTKTKIFFNRLAKMNCISPLWEKVIDVLLLLQPNISYEALAVFCIYFSQLDDGNICIPLTPEELIEKWQKKWEGLLLQEDLLNYKDKDNKFFADIIEKGLPQISSEILPELIEYYEAPKTEEETEKPLVFSKPFVIDSGWLFAAKYFKAKIKITKNIGLIMKNNPAPTNEDKIAEIRDYFKNLTASDSSDPMILKDEQIHALLRGLNDNLIITGGPGTGKTTVVCYLLWKLFLSKDSKGCPYMDYNLYLAAPSGKAADRMKESISDELAKLHLENISEAPKKALAQSVFDKLNNAQSSTIHRLLSFNPATNGFRYNEKKPDEKSIFVIDEASMIDITLFSSLLEAIPNDARVFILGDKDQLPSVQAGAVLGELLAKKTDSVAELKQSSRFADNSDVGYLKDAMQEEKPLDKDLTFFTQWDDEWKKKHNFALIPENSYPVTIFIPQSDYEERKVQVEDIIDSWTNAFYSGLVQKAQEVSKNLEGSDLDDFWETANKARILCAERKGLLGVETINDLICSKIPKAAGQSADNDYFTGQLLMLTKNQTLFCLYNGDSGIVIEHNNLKYLMVKKEIKENTNPQEETATNYRSLIQQGIFQKGCYIFYPLHLLQKESIESSYAITIHKAQGSGYPAILVFLPSQPGHPLLNRQIAYTAITRTKGSTYIFADYDTLEAARATVIQRDTRIEL